MRISTSHRRQAAGVALVVGVLLAAGCGATVPQSESSSAQAQELAGQLNQALKQEGLSAPSTGTATALYGEDGGVSCVNVGEAEQRDGLVLFGHAGQLTYGRRVTMDPSVLAYDRAVIETYCPNELASYKDAVAGLDTEPTIP